MFCHSKCIGRAGLAAFVLTLFIASPIKANEAQWHILNFGINVGWAEATMHFYGDTNPVRARNISAALATARRHLDAAESLMQEPYATIRRRDGVGERLRRKIIDYGRIAGPRSRAGKENYIKNLWSMYSQSFQTTFATHRADRIHYQPNCDFFTLNVGYYFGRAHIAAGVQSSQARSYQNGAMGSMRQAIYAGVRIAMDGGPPQPGVRKVCCSFGSPAGWRFFTGLPSNAAFAVFANNLTRLQNLVRRSQLRAGQCGGCIKGCKKIIGVWRFHNNTELHVCPNGTFFTRRQGRVVASGQWHCQDDCRGIINLHYRTPHRRRVTIRLTGTVLRIINQVTGQTLADRTGARPDCRGGRAGAGAGSGRGRRFYPGIPGTWQWFAYGDVVFRRDGTCIQPSSRRTCTWNRTGNQLLVRWSHRFYDKLTISPDGRRLEGFGSRNPRATSGHRVWGIKRPN